MEIADGIHRIQAPLGDRFVCMYLLLGESAALLIDTGLAPMPAEVLDPYLGRIGVGWDRVRYVLTSHIDFDHTGGNAAVRERAPQACFMCHELDRPMIQDVEAMIIGRYACYAHDHGIDETDETKDFIRASAGHVLIDLALRGGERLRLSPDWVVDILHTPGHSLGHLSVWDRRSASLIILDAALGDAVLTAEGEPAFPPTYRYPSSYESTIRRLMAMRAKRVLTSHYPAYEGEAGDAFLALGLGYVDRVEDALRGAIRGAGGGITMRGLIDQTSAALGDWPDGTYLCWPFAGHLERMLEHGLIAKSRESDIASYRWIG